MNPNPAGVILQGVITRQACPGDISDAEWGFVLPCRCLLSEGAGQRRYALRDILDALRRVSAPARPGGTRPRTSRRGWRPGSRPDAGCFGGVVNDLRAMLRFADGRDSG